MISMTLTLWADNGQEVTINGQRIEKTIIQLTFSGDNIIMRFEDNTIQSADMADVSIILNSTTDIRELQAFTVSQPLDGKLEIRGVAAGHTICLYDTTGKKLVQTMAKTDITTIDITSFKRGIYLMKTGKQIIKFIKRS